MAGKKQYIKSWDSIFDERIEKVPAQMNAIDFVEGPGGTGIILRPVQRVLVKALFAVPFDYRPPWADAIEGWGMVPMWDVYREKLIRTVTEEEYLHIVNEEGRCNVKDWRDIPERGFNEGVVFCGRRGGKSEVVAAIAAYKLYLTLLINSPQRFFGLAEGSQIDFTFLAQDETGAGRLFKKLAAAVNRASWFHPYLKDNNSKNLSFICEAAPRRAASSILAIALSRLRRGSGAQLIWMRPTATLPAGDPMTIVIATARHARYHPEPLAALENSRRLQHNRVTWGTKNFGPLAVA